jgi:hypothetical protein
VVDYPVSARCAACNRLRLKLARAGKDVWPTRKCNNVSESVKRVSKMGRLTIDRTASTCPEKPPNIWSLSPSAKPLRRFSCSSSTYVFSGVTSGRETGTLISQSDITSSPDAVAMM